MTEAMFKAHISLDIHVWDVNDAQSVLAHCGARTRRSATGRSRTTG